MTIAGGSGPGPWGFICGVCGLIIEGMTSWAGMSPGDGPRHPHCTAPKERERPPSPTVNAPTSDEETARLRAEVLRLSGYSAKLEALRKEDATLISTWANRAEEAEAKWREYENKYILPCFAWAREVGFDLQAAVHEHAGRNCVELLVSHLRERMADASPRARELVAALLACEHFALTAADPKDMQDDVVAAIERVLGKPGDSRRLTPHATAQDGGTDK